MNTIDMTPSTVASLGAKAGAVGADVSGCRRHVEAAWDQGSGASIDGFATHGALLSYTSSLSDAISALGDAIANNGTRLTASAAVVGMADRTSAEDVGTVSSAIGAINSEVLP